MISRIVLDNYRVYGHLDRTFDNLSFIQGANGTGKTSLVEAIGFALFGSTMQRGKAKEWIKRGESNGSVTLYIDKYVIYRSSTKATVSIGEKVIARNNLGITKWVEQTYGLTPELFKTSFYIGQKEIGNFAALGPMERTARVEKLLRIDKLDEIKNTAKELARDQLAIINANTTAIAYDPAKLEKFKLLKEEAKNVVATETKNLEELLIQKGKYDSEIALYEEYQRLYASWNGLNYDIEKMQAQYDNSVQHNALVQNNNARVQRKQTLEKKLSNVNINEKYFKYNSFEIRDQEIAIKKYNLATTRLEELNCEPNKHDMQMLRDEYAAKKELVSVNKNIPKVCPTCGQDWPEKSRLDIPALESELTKLYELIQLCAAENESYEILQKLVVPKYSKAEVEAIKESLFYKAEYEELQLLKDVSPQELIVLDFDIVEVRRQQAIFERLTAFGKRSAPKYIDVGPTKNIIEKNKEIIAKATQVISQQERAGELTKNKEAAEARLAELRSFIKFIDQFRKSFGNNVIPLLETNVSTIVNYLTEGKYEKITINPDYGINNFEYYSGSEQDAISFALRLSIAQISKLGSFKTMILDEVAASFDSTKEQKLLEILKQQQHQLIYITHGAI